MATGTFGGGTGNTVIGVELTRTGASGTTITGGATATGAAVGVTVGDALRALRWQAVIIINNIKTPALRQFML